PCVIFTEVDFDTFDERIARKLFVGATRATMKLIVVASQRAARYLQLGEGAGETAAINPSATH
ncbi:MAG TPA: ATP-binding domain-containing protein, partial [Paraburkholderia sp.]